MGTPIECLCLDGPPALHKINLILRDWDKRKAGYAKKSSDYPAIPFLQLEVPCWTAEEQADYINMQWKDHKLHPMRECTDEEKWQRGTVYAVMNKRGTRAVNGGLFETREEAEKLFDKTKHKCIEERPGEKVRCEYYCTVSKVCPYFNKNLEDF